MHRLLGSVVLVCGLLLASSCGGGKCPHVCYCCQSVTYQGEEARCADVSYKVLMPASSSGPVCFSCKSGCEDKAPGTTAIGCNDYGTSGENYGCRVDE